MTNIKFASVSLDCADPAALAEFWSALLGAEIVWRSEDFVALKTDRVWIATVKDADYRVPTWPNGDVPKQMHLDLSVDDLDGAEADALRLGATKAQHQPEPDRWRVFFDPAGHPFCLTTQIPD